MLNLSDSNESTLNGKNVMINLHQDFHPLGLDPLKRIELNELAMIQIPINGQN